MPEGEGRHSLRHPADQGWPSKGPTRGSDSPGRPELALLGLRSFFHFQIPSAKPGDVPLGRGNGGHPIPSAHSQQHELRLPTVAWLPGQNAPHPPRPFFSGGRWGGGRTGHCAVKECGFFSKPQRWAALISGESSYHRKQEKGRGRARGGSKVTRRLGLAFWIVGCYLGAS